MISLRLLGSPLVERSGEPIPSPATQRRRLALVSLLSAYRDAGISRDKLLAHLWPDMEADRGRHLLSNAVYALRQALGREVILSNGSDGLRLNPECVRVDVWEFLDALEQDEPERAAGLYAGPFLDGLFLLDAPEFERWTQGERDRLARLYAEALEALAQGRESEGDLRGAVVWWRRLAAHDPFSSRVALRLMQALAAAGDTGGAIQHANIHAALLRNELGVEPDEEVEEFVDQLRAGRQDSRPADRTPPPPLDQLSVSRTDPFPSREANPGPAPEKATQRGSGPLVPPYLSQTPQRRHLRRLALGGVALLPLIATGLLYGGRRPETPETSPAIRSLAVLPLENCTPDPRRAERPDPEQEYFADGLTDALITELAQIPGLRVTSRTSAMKYKGECGSRESREKSLPQIAQELGVDVVVEGTVIRDGERVRINAQLIRAATDEHLWADGLEYERDLREVLLLQGEIAAAIAREVRLHASSDRATQAKTAQTVDPEAYELYLRGRYAWNRRTGTELEQAVRYFRESIARDSLFALSYVGLADSYFLLPLYTGRAAKDWYPLAKEAALRALALDSMLAPAYATLGGVAVFEWEWKEAERAYRRAIQLDPNYATVRQWYAELLTIHGRYEEALHEARRAQRLDPLSPMIGTVIAWTLMGDGQPVAAEQELLRILEREPNFAPANEHLGHAWTQQGRYAEAIEQYRRAEALTGRSSPCTIGIVHARAGNRAETRAILAELRQRSEVERVDPLALACLHAVLGDRERSLTLLEQAYRENHVGLTFVGMAGWSAPLRSDPRFQALLERIGLEQ